MSSNARACSSSDDPVWDRFLRRGALGLIALYQYLLSPLLGGQCRFHPSCSHYAREAFERRRFFTACRLVLWRLVRCHPFHPGGYDPLDPDPPEPDAPPSAPPGSSGAPAPGAPIPPAGRPLARRTLFHGR